MIDQKRILAIIPARAGSKRVKDKNLKDLAGKPLIAWTIEAAKASKYIDHIYVSTDSLEIQKISQDLDVDADPLRSDELATDISTSTDVILDVVTNLKTDFDIIVLLQPTSPLRVVGDIDQAIELYVAKQAKSVVSVCEAECHPSWVGAISDDLKMDELVSGLKAKRSQDLETFYRLNGAIYIMGAQDFKIDKTFYLKVGTYSYIMPRSHSIDIDTEQDFRLAQLMKLS